MLISLLPFFLVLLFPSFIQLATARLVNVTIDDTGLNSISNETVAYDPPDAWNSAVVCHNNPCFVKPDTTQVLNGTWHESTVSSQHYVNYRQLTICSFILKILALTFSQISLSLLLSISMVCTLIMTLIRHFDEILHRYRGVCVCSHGPKRDIESTAVYCNLPY